MTVAAFLDAAGWGEAQARPLAADASARTYSRLSKAGETAVLMDAPVDTAQDRASFAAFRTIGAHLRGLGLSAPREYAADAENGLILMEDLGDLTLSHLLATDADRARLAYGVTVDMLPILKALPPPGLSAPDARAMAAMARITFDRLHASDALRDGLLTALADALATHAHGPPILSLRDVHGDNLLWLADRTGPARIGLLDFQDAVLLPDGYDLASLLDDPRRVVPEDWRRNLIEQLGHDPRRIDILSLARNLRILGIFRRLSTELGKPQYAAFLPRTRTLIARAAEPFPTIAPSVADLLDRTKDWTAT
ncbi:aminoglycoside phosphotransferase family protein [Hasllibacter sp. MH4015]|uniref:aminoglycoside phosphotransferase family protein n=1 Tax=Hasllibacter sp. MH4015 TaxID=2854029 RepID=UPI001CD35F2F|nr:phosphotransferase [Hasllibacter sp. MH4015]